MLTLNNISGSPGSNKNTKRLGRGQGSGQGTQAGKGHKGQKARKSGHVRSGFEGNNLPLYMRLPKRGFGNSVFAKQFCVITLESISKKYISGETVNKESLVLKKIISGLSQNFDLKIIGSSELPKNIQFEGISKYSEGAKKNILDSSCVIK
jgi:large subunit ribosomal protein L15